MQFGSDVSESLGIDEACTPISHDAFAFIREAVIEIFSDDDFKDSVAEEFETFVVTEREARVFVQIRTMNHGLLKQLDVREFEVELGGKDCEIFHRKRIVGY